jgi:hypothetical protein
METPARLSEQSDDEPLITVRDLANGARERSDTLREIESRMWPAHEVDRRLKEAPTKLVTEVYRPNARHFDYNDRQGLWREWVDTQAFFIWLYRGARPDQSPDAELTDTMVSKRYLSFLVAGDLLAHVCPLRVLSPARAQYLLSLTVEQAKKFYAYLLFNERTKRGSDCSPETSRLADYLAGCEVVENSWRLCPDPHRSDCVAKLARCHQRLCTQIFHAKVTDDISCVIDAKREVARRDNALTPDTEVTIARFAAEFYGWFNAGPTTISAKLARTLLRRFYAHATIVNMVEFTTKCFIAREHPDIHAEVRRDWGACP